MKLIKILVWYHIWHIRCESSGFDSHFWGLISNCAWNQTMLLCTDVHIFVDTNVQVHNCMICLFQSSTFCFSIVHAWMWINQTVLICCWFETDSAWFCFDLVDSAWFWFDSSESNSFYNTSTVQNHHSVFQSVHADNDEQLNLRINEDQRESKSESESSSFYTYFRFGA